MNEAEWDAMVRRANAIEESYHEAQTDRHLRLGGLDQSVIEAGDNLLKTEGE